MNPDETDTELLRARINQETGQVAWVELLRFFAQGRVVVVGPGLDLVDVAARIAGDQADEIDGLISQGKVSKVSDDQARRWIASDALLWTVVVKPWVLVQERTSASERRLH